MFKTDYITLDPQKAKNILKSLLVRNQDLKSEKTPLF